MPIFDGLLGGLFGHEQMNSIWHQSQVKQYYQSMQQQYEANEKKSDVKDYIDAEFEVINENIKQLEKLDG